MATTPVSRARLSSQLQDDDDDCVPLVPVKARRLARVSLGQPSEMVRIAALEAQRDALAALLQKSLEASGALIVQLNESHDFAADTAWRASDYRGAYRQAFQELREVRKQECAAACCEADANGTLPVLMRLVRCRHYVCTDYLTAQIVHARRAVKTTDVAQPLAVQCPLCRDMQALETVPSANEYISPEAQLLQSQVDISGYEKVLRDVLDSPHVGRDGALARLRTFCERKLPEVEPLLGQDDDGDDGDDLMTIFSRGQS